MGIANRKILHTDILIIGGGTAGCYAALTVREHSDYSIIIAEKANIKRSGCLMLYMNNLKEPLIWNWYWTASFPKKECFLLLIS